MLNRIRNKGMITAIATRVQGSGTCVHFDSYNPSRKGDGASAPVLRRMLPLPACAAARWAARCCCICCTWEASALPAVFILVNSLPAGGDEDVVGQLCEVHKAIIGFEPCCLGRPPNKSRTCEPNDLPACSLKLPCCRMRLLSLGLPTLS